MIKIKKDVFLVFTVFAFYSISLGWVNLALAREGCNRHCLDKIYSQMKTLSREVKNAIPIGTIMPFAGAGNIPSGYRLCDGSQVNKNDLPMLFEVIGRTFSPADEQSDSAESGHQLTFYLPDLKGRAPVGKDENRPLGQKFGSISQILTAANLPQHRHNGESSYNDKNHTHNGTTESSGTHSHGISELTLGTTKDNGGSGASRGSGHEWNSQPLQGSISNGGEHTHTFTTQGQSDNHTHTILTDGGIGLNQDAFDISPPSLAVRYIIKAE